MQEKELLLEILKNTKELNTRMDNIKNRLNNIETSFSSRMDYIENRLNNIEFNHGERLQNIENIVTKIEHEHGEKIQVLFDYFVDQEQKRTDIKTDINNLETDLDKQNNRIYALEFYKQEMLNPK